MTQAVFLTTMGAKIRAARKAAKMSQQAVADICRMDDSSISQIECGNADSKLMTVKRIADALGKDVKDFL
jgi:transcriptional regulator with XRE-family HTH domain